MALLAAILLGYLLRKRRREALLFAGGSVLLALPWQIRNAALGGTPYVRQLLSADPYRPERGLMGFGDVLERVAANLQIYATRELPRIFDYEPGPARPLWVAVLLLALLLPALYSGLRRKDILILFLAVHLGLHLLWPQVWSDVRFLVPVVPVFYYALLEGGKVLAVRLRRPDAPFVAAVFAAALLASLFGASRLHARTGTYPPNWKRYFEAASWIRDHTPEDAIVCCRKGFLMFVQSRRRAISYPFTEDADELIRTIEERGASIVVLDRLGFGSTPRYLVPAVREHASRFVLLHVTRPPETYVLRLRPPGG